MPRARAILGDHAARQSKMAWASSLALAGALLLGVGVITWFAAHWNEISKLIKLLLIFLALTGSHVAHGLCMTRRTLPRLAQGMALLSVLFFGAAIMLIGQIYHIDAHFPDGIAQYYVPEGSGRQIERPQGGEKVAMLIAVDARGKSGILAVMFDGRERYRETLF